MRGPSQSSFTIRREERTRKNSLKRTVENIPVTSLLRGPKGIYGEKDNTGLMKHSIIVKGETKRVRFENAVRNYIDSTRTLMIKKGRKQVVGGGDHTFKSAVLKNGYRDTRGLSL